MTLTKKQIREAIKAKRISSFPTQYDYRVSIRGFSFETDKDNDLKEEDDTGHCTHVADVYTKREVVEAVYNWFKEYAAHVFEEI